MFIVGMILKQLRMRRAYHETVLELSRLDDKVLRDINVMRDEIPGIARRAAERAVA